MVEKYATKEDISYFVKLHDEDFDESIITDTFMKMIEARIDQMIIDHKKRPVNIRDRFNLLWSATVCIALEILCNLGKLTWSTGDVALQKLNRVTYGFQRWQPMFFFAQGSAEPFYQLLPHDTYRMMAYAYVKAYCRDDFFVQYGSPTPIPKVVRDDTSRGFGWNLDDAFIDLSDINSSVGQTDLDVEDGEWAHYQYLEDEPL